MISCREVTTVMMAAQFDAQMWLRRIQIPLHLMMCKVCSRVVREIEQLRLAVRVATPTAANPEFEDDLIRRLLKPL